MFAKLLDSRQFQRARERERERERYIYIYIYFYIYTRVDLSLYRDRVCRNPKVKLQSRTVDRISKLRHPVGKVSIADNDSKIRQRQCKPTKAVKVDKGCKSRQRQ